MRKPILFIILMTIVLSISAGRSLAYMPDAPDVPALPLNDDFICGDVNEDGFVNVLDIISMVNYIMGGTPSPFNLEAADINADDGINVLDIIALVNIIMQVPGIPCPCAPTVTYGDQLYNTVKIGDQCWFKENLNVGTMLINGAGYDQSNNGVIEKFCYNNEASNCNAYGGLYEWPEAMQYVTTEGARGICPEGWHLPADNEWKILEGTVDNQYPVGDQEWEELGCRGLDAGGNLKETGTSHWDSPNTGATNESGFTALPGGYTWWNGEFWGLGVTGYYWLSTHNHPDYAHIRFLDYNNACVSRTTFGKDNGVYIRCVKNCEPQPSQASAGPDQLNVSGTSTTLAGNIPDCGTGAWTIVSGTGGAFENTSNPASIFNGQAGNAYTLAWTISNGCGSSIDTVIISFAPGLGQPCPGIPTITYEGQIYNTVLIGSQCWLRENLNAGTMIINGSNYNQSNNGIIEKFCYNNEASNCDIYGGLYEWPESMQYVTTEGAQGICPEGWHLPTDNEWKVMEGTIDSQYPVGDPEWNKLGCRGLDAGGKLKEAGTVYWNPPNTGATNESGFSALPGGYTWWHGGYWGMGITVYFWLSTQSHSDYAYIRWVNYDNACVHRTTFGKDNGVYVRCLKNEYAP